MERRLRRPAVELLENRLVLAAVSAIVDDGGLGYADGLATGASLVATPGVEQSPAIARDAAGNLHAVYDGGGRAMYFIKSKGATDWSAPVDIGAIDVSEPRIAADSNGGLHVVYTGGFTETYHVYKPAGGSSWGAAVMVSTPGAGLSIKPAIAADGAGGVHLTFQDNGVGNYDVRYRKWQGGTWGAEEVVANSALAETIARVAAGPDGRASVVWQTDGADRMVQHRQRNADGSWAATQRLDVGTARSLEPDVAIGADNAVHVVWHEDLSGAGWDVVYAKMPSGGAFSSPAYVTNAGVVDAFVNVTVAPDNTPRISWMDYQSVYLGTPASGGGWDKRIVIAEKGATRNAIGVDGFGRTFILAQAQKTGVTNANSWDLWSYADPAKVVGRSLFYNNSAFDGNNAVANASDDNAIAPDKVALLPGGGAATFANYSGYSKGINGVMIDVVGIPASVTTLNASDFTFRAGNDLLNPSGWASGPTPASVTLRRGAGVGGSDRVTLTWPDYNAGAPNPAVQAVAKRWLQVTLGATANTGVSIPDTFMFGNAVGETGNAASNTFVDGVDFAGVRDNPRGFANLAPITFPYDLNRDRFVDGADLAIARDNSTGFVNSLKLVNPPAITGGAGGSAWATMTGSGYQNDYRSTAAGSGNKFATYQFEGLPAGRYTIEIAWEASASNATNVPVALTTGTGGRQDFVINQQIAPSGTIIGGKHFQAVANIDLNGTARLMFTDAANGAVNVDAVRIINGTELVASTPGYDLTPDVVAAPNGDLHMVYHSGDDPAIWRVYYRFKPAGGDWNSPLQIGGMGQSGGTAVPHIGLAPDGTLHVTYHQNDRVWYVRRPAGSSSWTAAIQVPGQAHKALETDLAVDSLGRAHLVWHEDLTDESRGWDIRYSFRDAAGNWSTPVSASPSGNDDVFPTIAAGPDNAVHLAWMNYDDRKIHYRSRDAAGAWSGEQFLDNESGRSNAPDLVVGPDNTVHAVFMEDRQATKPGSSEKRGFEIAYVRKPAGGSWSSPHYFDHYDSSQYIDIDPAVGVGTDGSVAVTWSDYNEAYISRKHPSTGVWSPMRTIYDDPLGDVDRGAKANVIAINPIDNSTHVMFMARTDGRTNGNSWDVFYYQE